MTLVLASERQQIASFGRKLVEHRLTRGTSGNLSIYNRSKSLMAISPSGRDYFQTAPQDVAVIDLSGRIVDGTNKPSSEWALHRILYENRDDISSVVHTHSPFSTVLSCLGWELPALHYMIALAGPTVRCAAYASFGTEELAANAMLAIADCNAVFLANHGLLTAGSDLANAFHIAEEIEFCAELYWRCKCVGEPIILGEAEMALMKNRFRTYGQVTTTSGK